MTQSRCLHRETDATAIGMFDVIYYISKLDLLLNGNSILSSDNSGDVVNSAVTVYSILTGLLLCS